MIDLNLYKGFVEDTIYYKDAFIDGEKVCIYINFADLTYFPNPITFTLIVKFGFKKNGGFIQYECKNINYFQLFLDKFKLILKCVQVSGFFNDNNVGNSYLVIDSNIIDFNSVLENLINSIYYFSVDNQFYTFDGSLFETNLEDIDSYINIVKNSKILNIDQCKVIEIIDNLNYGYLNTTSKPLVKVETINNSSQDNEKDFVITLTFLEETIESLGKRNSELLIEDILFKLFEAINLVFFSNIVEFSSPDSNLKIKNRASINNTSSKDTGSHVEYSISTSGQPNLCVTGNQTVSLQSNIPYNSLYVEPSST